MPRRKRRKDKPQKKTEPQPREKTVEEVFEGYSVSDMRNFSKTDSDSYIIIYRVPTGHLGDEEVMKHYRSKMISALQNLGRTKGVIINVPNMKFGVFPDGANSLVKAFCYKKDTAKGRAEIAEKQKDAYSGTNFDWAVKEKGNSRFTR